MRRNWLIVLAACAVAMLGEAAYAVPPYFQDFTNGLNGWRQTNSGANPLAPIASGGPDGGAYVSANSTSTAGTPILFRAKNDFPGIDLGFTGDWLTAGVKQVSAYVRHNAPVAIPFFTRMTEIDTNAPGVFFVDTALVAPNVWTQVYFNVTASSPQFTNPEGADYATVMGNVGNFQIGPWLMTSPALPAGTYAYDLDKVDMSLVPEPASGLLASLGAMGLALRARRQK